MPFLISHETLLAYERPLCATSGHSITTHYAKAICRRQIEKSPLAQIEMSLSTVLVGEFWADDGDCDEPDGDRPDERVARSGGWQIKVAEASTLMGLGRRQLSANEPGSSELAARCQSRNALQLLQCWT